MKLLDSVNTAQCVLTYVFTFKVIIFYRNHLSITSSPWSIKRRKVSVRQKHDLLGEKSEEYVRHNKEWGPTLHWFILCFWRCVLRLTETHTDQSELHYNANYASPVNKYENTRCRWHNRWTHMKIKAIHTQCQSTYGWHIKVLCYCTRDHELHLQVCLLPQQKEMLQVFTFHYVPFHGPYRTPI